MTNTSRIDDIMGKAGFRRIDMSHPLEHSCEHSVEDHEGEGYEIGVCLVKGCFCNWPNVTISAEEWAAVEDLPAQFIARAREHETIGNTCLHAGAKQAAYGVAAGFRASADEVRSVLRQIAHIDALAPGKKM